MTQVAQTSIPHYIGITGVQTPSEIQQLVVAAESFSIGPSHSHNLMLGVLVSPATINNGEPLHTKKPYRHVADRETLRDILLLAKEKKIIGMLHFELHKEWPGTAGDALSVITLLQFLAQSNLLPPVQLNGVILPEEFRRIHHETGAPLVLQLRQELTHLGTEAVLSYIESIQGAVSKILMDPSAGAGEAISVQGAVTLYREIEARFPGRFTYGFAGGLGGASPTEQLQTSKIIQDLLSFIPSGEFSVDSETKVRKPSPTGGCDVLDLELSRAYFSAVRSGLP